MYKSDRVEGSKYNRILLLQIDSLKSMGVQRTMTFLGTKSMGACRRPSTVLLNNGGNPTFQLSTFTTRRVFYPYLADCCMRIVVLYKPQG
jgi:hypothetical protein